jgi:hypothetical protein
MPQDSSGSDAPPADARHSTRDGPAALRFPYPRDNLMTCQVAATNV